MLTSERFLDLVLREALRQAVKHDKPACRRCKSWHREVAQWTVVAQNARPPRFWLPWLTFTRTQTARSQARKQTQIWLRYTRRCKVAFESSSWRSLDLEKGHWTITERSQRIARYRTLRLSARHSLRHVAPVPVSMCPNLSANVVTSIGFQNLPWHREVVTLPN